MRRSFEDTADVRAALVPDQQRIGSGPDVALGGDGDSTRGDGDGAAPAAEAAAPYTRS